VLRKERAQQEVCRQLLNKRMSRCGCTCRLKNRLTPICPTRGDLPFAFRLRTKKQQLGPGPPHAPQITKTHPNAPQQGAQHSRTFGQNLGGEKGECSTSTCPNHVRKRGNSMKMRHEPRGTNVGKSTMKTGN